MAKSADWKQNALVLIALALGVIFAAVLGIISFINATTPTLHPNAKDVSSVTHAPPSPAWADAVEQGRRRARAGLVEQNLPGLSVAVGVDGDIVWAEGFGWANVEKQLSVTPRTRFRIGHVSKALTSAAVGLLLETRRLHLGEDIQTYVPSFPRQQWPVTLRQLMGHVAGVRHYDSESDYMPTAHCERASDALHTFANDPLRFEPGTRHRYSTFGWILVSAAVEAAAGEPFFRFMRTQVFDPLGMADTTSDFITASIPDVASFYSPRFSGDPSTGPEPAATVDYSCFAGAGAFLSTPSDLVRFGLGLNRLLKPDTVTLLQTPQLLPSGEETDYGLGWLVETVPLAGEPARLMSHASQTLLGGSTSFLTFPERGTVVAVTSNVSRAGTRSIALSIAQAFADEARRRPRK